MPKLQLTEQQQRERALRAAIARASTERGIDHEKDVAAVIGRGGNKNAAGTNQRHKRGEPRHYRATVPGPISLQKLYLLYHGIDCFARGCVW